MSCECRCAWTRNWAGQSSLREQLVVGQGLNRNNPHSRTDHIFSPAHVPALRLTRTNGSLRQGLLSPPFSGRGQARESQSFRWTTVYWYRLAADQANRGLRIRLGFLHCYSQSVPKVPDESFRWYRRAAELGHAVAQVNLGQKSLGDNTIVWNSVARSGNLACTHVLSAGGSILRTTSLSMGAHITKTTIDIAKDLAVRARELAARRGTTFRAVVEQGLRMALEGDQVETQYRLPDKSVQGRGLHREFRTKHRSDILEASFGGRGL